MQNSSVTNQLSPERHLNSQLIANKFLCLKSCFVIQDHKIFFGIEIENKKEVIAVQTTIQNARNKDVSTVNNCSHFLQPIWQGEHTNGKKTVYFRIYPKNSCSLHELLVQLKEKGKIEHLFFILSQLLLLFKQIHAENKNCKFVDFRLILLDIENKQQLMSTKSASVIDNNVRLKIPDFIQKTTKKQVKLMQCLKSSKIFNQNRGKTVQFQVDCYPSKPPNKQDFESVLARMFQIFHRFSVISVKSFHNPLVSTSSSFLSNPMKNARINPFKILHCNIRKQSKQEQQIVQKYNNLFAFQNLLRLLSREGQKYQRNVDFNEQMYWRLVLIVEGAQKEFFQNRSKKKMKEQSDQDQNQDCQNDSKYKVSIEEFNLYKKNLWKEIQTTAADMSLQKSRQIQKICKQLPQIQHEPSTSTSPICAQISFYFSFKQQSEQNLSLSLHQKFQQQIWCEQQQQLQKIQEQNETIWEKIKSHILETKSKLKQ